MNNLPEELHKLILATRACMADLRTLAVALFPLPVEQINLALQGFVDEGEESATSRLLQACAFNAVKLDPEVLCRSIGVCEDILDSAPCFRKQDESIIEPLLAAAVSEELSPERRRYAARLAAELTVKRELDPQPVRKVLWKLEHAAMLPESQLLIGEALQLLDGEALPDLGLIPHWSDIEIADLLPEHSPRHVVGGNYTVRRPIAKIGRNDPCHYTRTASVSIAPPCLHRSLPRRSKPRGALLLTTNPSGGKPNRLNACRSTTASASVSITG